jgi:hypothetical protein
MLVSTPVREERSDWRDIYGEEKRAQDRYLDFRNVLLVNVQQSSSLTPFKRQIKLIDLSKHLSGSVTYVCLVTFCANCLGAASVSRLNCDLWHSFLQLYVLLLTIVTYVFCYAGNLLCWNLINETR